MKKTALTLVVTMLAASTVLAQSASTRAWQQRLEIEIPLPVPMVELQSINPFAEPVDEPAALTESSIPKKVDIVGTVSVAAFVDSKGECLGIVPLELPLPGLTAPLANSLTGSRFEPAMAGSAPQPSWVVLEIDVKGRVKDGFVSDQVFELPDPDAPPVPKKPAAMAPPGRLRNLTATAHSKLSSLAEPRRVRVGAPAREDRVPLRALVHITKEGRCDRYVPLELDDGLNNWVSAFLATWRLKPATRDGAAVDSWLVYSAQASIRLSGIDSTDHRVVKDHDYSPSR